MTKLVHRAWHLEEPRRLTVEIHETDCLCRACAPDRLDTITMGKLAAAGAAAGTMIAFVYDPAGAAHALAAIFTGAW
ncbi:MULTISPECIES: hypothetical protein [unclassified Sphingomonas]|uniref:hypothetical protein n=1 Tax=unclassified Sphingomonas TaxID=196159 RepID=UPI00226A55F8|nr:MULTISPECIES: hypothetical protein [unclassified Sphingomonas]